MDTKAIHKLDQNLNLKDFKNERVRILNSTLGLNPLTYDKNIYCSVYFNISMHKAHHQSIFPVLITSLFFMLLN